MRALVNRLFAPSVVPAPSSEAAGFHAALAGYEPTPLPLLAAVAEELGIGAVALKDESHRLGLPSFKVLGASWAVERALRVCPDLDTLVAASAGNHGRAVAHVAARRGLACRVHLPVRAAPARREAIAAEGADLVVDGSYEDAVARAAAEGARSGALEVADVGASATARWVIDGYATLFAEADAAGGTFDLVLVPVGVGSLAAAAARFGARAGAKVIGVEPVTAACLTASLTAGEPEAVPTPGTTMAGLDCGEVSPAAWPSLRDGICGAITVSDAEVHAAMRELAAAGLAIGDCGAAPLAALRALVTESGCDLLRGAVGLRAETRVLLLATEGPTDPAAYRRVVG